MSNFSKKLLNQLNSVRANSSYFIENENQKSIRKICRKLADKYLMPVASELDRKCLFPKSQIEQLGTSGFMGILVSSDYGGTDSNTVLFSTAVAELSRGCAGTGAIVNIHNALYMDVINRFGTDDQKKKYLSNFVSGINIGSFALSESAAGSDAAGILTTATPTDSGWILNGTKTWVTNAREAKAVIVFASIDMKKRHEGICAFIVDIPSEGLSIGQNINKLGIRASSTCNISLENVFVPSYNLLGEKGFGFKLAMSALDCARIGIASQAIGIAEASLECTINYATDEKTFGNTLITNKAVKHRIGRMFIQLETAKLLTQSAAWARSKQPSCTKEAAMAKFFAAEVATSVSHSCIQIFGEVGYIPSMLAERLYRDARITEIYGGVTDVLLSVITEQYLQGVPK